MTKGMIFNIQHFCLDDGPGIRTTVFLKGCPLRCSWCHNPESQSMTPEILYDAALCIGCGACATVCPAGAHKTQGYNRSVCTACGNCATFCPSGALEYAGKGISIDDVLLEVLRDVPFYKQQEGGLTLSGGEPLLQYAFSKALLTEAKKAGIHTCLETCGYATAEQIGSLAEVTDLFLYDWKLTDPALHKLHTGVENTVIKENLLLLDSLGKSIVLRCPIIPDINDTDDHFMGIAALSNTCRNILAIELESYHCLGTKKCKHLGKPAAQFRTPCTEEVSLWQEKLAALTAKKIRIA